MSKHTPGSGDAGAQTPSPVTHSAEDSDERASQHDPSEWWAQCAPQVHDSGDDLPDKPAITDLPAAWDRTSWSVTTRAGLEALVLLATGAFSFFLLGLGGADDVEVKEWLVWRGAASLGIGLAAMFFVRALAALTNLPPGPSKSTTAATRSAPAPVAFFIRLWDHDKRPVIGYLVVSFLLVVGALAFLGEYVESREWKGDISEMDRRLTWVAVSVALLATPWIALLLLSENMLRRWRHRVRDQASSIDDFALGAYLQLWDLITHCLMAFGAFVVIALLPTGALRALWLATQEGREDQFPATDVLLYGAFFATILGVVTLPALASWRATSWRIVDAKVPLPKLSDVKTERMEERQRLTEVLHLDQGLLRNPLTIFSVFLPLVTATLAAFLPQLES